MQGQNIQKFIELFLLSLKENKFLKLTLSKYRGQEKELKNVYIRRVEIKGKLLLSFVYRYKTKDITKNYDERDSVTELTHLLENGFSIAYLFTSEQEIEMAENKMRIRKLKQSVYHDVHHDKVKSYLIDPSLPFWHDLDISTQKGDIKKESYSKFKQINKFVEHMTALYESSSLKTKSSIRIIDFGSGKGYLTFAVYWYFQTVLNKDVTVTGVDIKEDLNSLLNDTARKYGYTKLNFVTSDIASYSGEASDIVIALHACDTATDGALAYGIKNNASLIIAAPCCHKCVRKEMTVPEIYSDILKHGILTQRYADLLTDGLRSMTLEYFGYKSQIGEFISSEHTAKNILLSAVKQFPHKDETMLKKIYEIKKTYGIKNYYLDTIVGIDTYDRTN